MNIPARLIIQAGNKEFRIMKKNEMKTRCDWGAVSPLFIDYYDNEWGVPVHDDRKLFEFLILEGAQAGLSGETVLKKRGNYPEQAENNICNK